MSNGNNSTGKMSKAAKISRAILGIVMVIIFVAMGVLLLIGFFNPIFGPGWEWLRWVGGVVFILYGIFRGYRWYNGNDVLVDQRDDDE